MGWTDIVLLADVYINIPIKSISQAYTYIVPTRLSFLTVGWRVIVPFGGRSIEGFIVSVRNMDEGSIKGDFKLKEIKDTLDEEAWFTPEVIKAARWMADFYLCSVGEMMRLFIPGKGGAHIQLAYEAMAADDSNVLLQVEAYRRVYEAVQVSGIAKKREIKEQLIADDHAEVAEGLDNILDKLLQYSVLKRVYDADNKAKAAYETVYVTVRPVTEELLADFSRKPAQKKALSFILAHQQDNELILTADVFKHQKVSPAVLKALTDNGILRKEQRRIYRDSYALSEQSHQDVELTTEQQQAVEGLAQAICAKEYKEFLLYGVTGSGKTQVYIEAAQRARQLGRRVVVLVPEIALTGQVVQAFKSYFAHDIIVIHSRLSINERNDAVLRVRRGEAGIIIGARSALFTPADNIGLIIMDEEQDNSYKQDESPRYHARVVAQELARIYGSTLLLGSATPSLETYHKAQMGQCTMLRLPNRIGNKPLPQVTCVDMRQELKKGRRNIISHPLRLLIEDTISKGEQMIIMLNRRGFATFVMCRSCGEVIRCPQCTMPLVYHKDKRLMCHHCDIRVPVPDVCPKCESRYIKYFGSGTEKLEQELRSLVPQARVIRMDRDTTTGKFGHTNIINRFRSREFDILLGTQMVAKGHDIPNVTAVGIISADSALNMPDFRAAERVFMLITQTAGRAGRGDIPGKVIVQSYSPEHNAVQSGIKQDYQAFYEEEMKLRESLFYPPFCRIVKLIVHNEKPEAARQQAQNIKDNFLNNFGYTPHHQIIGPAPAMIPAFKGVYRFSMLIKTDDLPAVNHFLREQGVHRDMNVLIDIDPITTS